ncbi:hypothetical protein K440DRAFT_101787 [Wilcoxina mikolae CBS 423.85]|nr:hypothetical protein K440DRAFT_101787 [Wilcoxina mikolae CBS 423.85]
MNSMAYTTYGFDQSYDPERNTYDDPTIYHPNAPLFTQQELCGFEPAQYTLAQSSYPMIGGEDMSMAMGGWELEVSTMKPMMGYSDMSSQYYGHEPNGYDMNMGYPQQGGEDYYSPMVGGCYQEEMVAGSCQASPFVDQTRLPPPSFQTSSFQHPISPVTPSGSPLLPQYTANRGLLDDNTPSAFLLVPVPSNGQYQYNAYPVPMPQLPVNDNYLGQLAYQDNQSAAFESQHPSPYTIPSLTASPLAKESRTPVEEEEEEDDEEDEEEEEEDDRSVIPNHGNKELRGMGLYDDTPDLIYPGCSTPASYSPITPHDQLRPTLGKGLVLERSFGLPEKMMIKDEKTGEIIEGKLRIDDEDESSWGSSPTLYNDDEDMY